MEYSAELFTTDKDISVLTGYHWVLSGAFYDVYSDGFGDYHMALEDKDSLYERAHFLLRDITKSNYPICSEKLGLINGPASQTELMKQVLGLPDEVMYVKDEKGNITYLPVKDILARIHFEKHLHLPPAKPALLRPSLLSQTSDAVIGAINDLIAHGFFFPNPERTLAPDDPDATYFPVYIDEEKVPASFLREKETPEKLFMDFTAEAISIDKNMFLRTFRRIEGLSLNEMAVFAYNRSSQGLSFEERVLKASLERYLNSLVRQLLNDYFDREFQTKGLFGSSVLTHDFGILQSPIRFAYVGTHFTMYATSFRHFRKEGGKVQEELYPSDYVFDEEDKDRLRLAFRATKNYFAAHPELSYLPASFLRIMGVPYPAFSFLAFFDFQAGDEESFLRALPFAKNRKPEGYGIILPLADDFGSLLPSGEWDTFLYFYLLELEKKGLFISSVFAFLSDVDVPYFFYSADSLDKRVFAFTSGDGEFYRESLDALEKRAYDKEISLESLTVIRNFLLKDEKDGKLMTAARFFEEMSQGKNTEEFDPSATSPDNPIALSLFLLLLYAAFLHAFEKDSEDYFHEVDGRQSSRLFPFVSQTERFDDPYLPLPHVYKGRQFIAYAGEDNILYFEKRDENAVTNLHKIFRRFFLMKNSFPYLLSIYGEDHYYDLSFDECHDYRSEALFLGLPAEAYDTLDFTKDILSQLHFREGISLLTDPSHRDLVVSDSSLFLMAVTEEGLQQGLYLLGSTHHPRAFYALKETMPEPIRLYFSPDFIKIGLEGLSHSAGQLSSSAKSIQELLDQDDDLFRSTFLDCVYGFKERKDIKGKLSQLSADLAYTYGGSLSRSSYQVIAHGFAGTEEESSHYLIAYPHTQDGKKRYVSPGASFFAFADDPALTSFALPAEDEKGLLSSLRGVRKLFGKTRSKKEKARLFTFYLGLPVAFQERAYRLFSAKSHPTQKDIHKLFGFTEKETVPFCDLAGYRNTLATEGKNLSPNIESTQLRHALIREGVTLFPGSSFSSLLDTPENEVALGSKAFQSRLSAIYLYLDEDLSGKAKEVFLPNAIAFSSYVDDFVEDYVKTSLTPDFLFYVKESLEYAYWADKKFLPHAINALQNGNPADYPLYLTKLFKGFRLKELKEDASPSEIQSFLSHFLFNMEVYYFVMVSKGLFRK